MFDSIVRYEIKARAFQIMTGKMAPGKDVPAAMARNDGGGRQKLWEEWCEEHGTLVFAVITAAEEILETNE